MKSTIPSQDDQREPFEWALILAVVLVATLATIVWLWLFV